MNKFDFKQMDMDMVDSYNKLRDAMYTLDIDSIVKYANQLKEDCDNYEKTIQSLSVGDILVSTITDTTLHGEVYARKGERFEIIELDCTIDTISLDNDEDCIIGFGYEDLISGRVKKVNT